MDPLVTIAAYLNPYEAYLARGVLESAGIECVLLDEHMSHYYGRASAVVGGVKLQVSTADEQTARALLSAEIEIAPEADG